MVHTDADEDFLLVSGVTEDLSSVDIECLERLWDLPTTDCGTCDVPQSIDVRLGQEVEQHRQSTLLEHSQSVGSRVKQLQDQLDQWAEDKLEPEKKKLEELESQKKQFRRQARTASTVDDQLQSQTQWRQTVKAINKQEEQIKTLHDELEDKLDEMFDKLKTTSQQKVTSQDVMTVKWRVI